MKPERRYHLTFADFFFFGVTVLLGLGAINSQNNLLFLLFGVAIGAILISGVLSGSMLLGISVQRECAGERCVDGRLHIRYRVTCRSPVLPVVCVRIEEIPETSGDWKGRFVPPLTFVAHVGAGETTIADGYAWPKRRGELRLHGIRVSTRFPFGLLRKSITIRQPQVVLVQPRALPLQRDTLAQLRARGESGRLSSQTQGRGDEFYGLRDYVPGDSIRLVAWRVSARSDALVVREHARPAVTRFMVVLDIAPVDPDDEPGIEAAERAIELAASVMRESVVRNCEVGIVVPAWGITHRPINSGRHLSALLDLLARLDIHAPSVEGAEHSEASAALSATGRSRYVPILVDTGAVGVAGGVRHAARITSTDFDRLVRVPPALDEVAR